MQLLGLPVVPGKWVSWSRRLSDKLAHHIEVLRSRKGQPTSAAVRHLLSLLAPLYGPVLLTCRTFGKLLLWRALLRPQAWLAFKLGRSRTHANQAPPEAPADDVHECFSLISASVTDSPQRAHSGTLSRLGDSSSGDCSDVDSDCVDAMLQFASIGCSEPQPDPWWNVPDDG